MTNINEALARDDLAPTGRLRVAINYGNPVLVQRDPVTGEARGVSPDLARMLAERLAVPVDFVPYETAGKVVDALGDGAWDVAYLARDPVRAAQIAFTSPYVIIEGTYLVAKDAPYRAVEDLDQAGIRIAVGKGAAYDLYLSRALQNAELVRAPTSADAIALFVAQKLEAAAGVRQPLVAHAKGNPSVRVIDGRFTAIEQAVGTPRDRVAGQQFLQAFIEEMKANGFVAAALQRSGQKDAAVAPPASI